MWIIFHYEWTGVDEGDCPHAKNVVGAIPNKTMNVPYMLVLLNNKYLKEKT